MSKTYIHPKVFAAMAALCLGLMATPGASADHDCVHYWLTGEDDRTLASNAGEPDAEGVAEAVVGFQEDVAANLLDQTSRCSPIV